MTRRQINSEISASLQRPTHQKHLYMWPTPPYPAGYFCGKAHWSMGPCGNSGWEGSPPPTTTDGSETKQSRAEGVRPILVGVFLSPRPCVCVVACHAFVAFLPVQRLLSTGRRSVGLRAPASSSSSTCFWRGIAGVEFFSSRVLLVDLVGFSTKFSACVVGRIRGALNVFRFCFPLACQATRDGFHSPTAW